MDKNTSGNDVQGAGSLESSEPVFLAVGKLRRPHGLNGEISMEIYTDFPERLVPGIQLFLGEDHLPIRLKTVREHQQLLLISLEGYHSREEVGNFRNHVVYVPLSNRPPLAEGEYYHHQLLGLEVYDESDRHLGKIIQILETGANDVFVIRSSNRADILLPYLDELVIGIDLEQGAFHTRLLSGLLPDE